MRAAAPGYPLQPAASQPEHLDIYPHMCAVELRKPAWIPDMVASARAFFQFDADSAAKLTQGYHAASLEEDFSGEVVTAAGKRLLEWVNIQNGPTNPPTALFRFVAVLQT